MPLLLCNFVQHSFKDLQTTFGRSLRSILSHLFSISLHLTALLHKVHSFILLPFLCFIPLLYLAQLLGFSLMFLGACLQLLIIVADFKVFFPGKLLNSIVNPLTQTGHSGVKFFELFSQLYRLICSASFHCK